MSSNFHYFSYLQSAHRAWKLLLQPGDSVVDATCGRGRDTAFLASTGAKSIWSLDIQEEALNSARSHLLEQLPMEASQRVHFLLHDHASVPEPLIATPLKLLVYNLGYLPGGDKSRTTTPEGTIKSLEAFYPSIVPGGAISIVSYVGHPGGLLECDAIIDWASKLPHSWVPHFQRRLNTPTAPVWFFLQRLDSHSLTIQHDVKWKL